MSIYKMFRKLKNYFKRTREEDLERIEEALDIKDKQIENLEAEQRRCDENIRTLFEALVKLHNVQIEHEDYIDVMTVGSDDVTKVKY